MPLHGPRSCWLPPRWGAWGSSQRVPVLADSSDPILLRLQSPAPSSYNLLGRQGPQQRPRRVFHPPPPPSGPASPAAPPGPRGSPQTGWISLFLPPRLATRALFLTHLKLSESASQGSQVAAPQQPGAAPGTDSEPRASSVWFIDGLSGFVIALFSNFSMLIDYFRSKI